MLDAINDCWTAATGMRRSSVSSGNRDRGLIQLGKGMQPEKRLSYDAF